MIQTQVHGSHKRPGRQRIKGLQPPVQSGQNRLGHTATAMQTANFLTGALQDGLSRGGLAQVRQDDWIRQQDSEGGQRSPLLCVGGFSHPPHPTPFLLHDTCSPPAYARLDAKSEAAVLRLLTLPDSNPAAKLIKAIAHRNRRVHKSNVRHMFSQAGSVCGALETLPEVIELSMTNTQPLPSIQGGVPTDKEAAFSLVTDNLTNPPLILSFLLATARTIPTRGQAQLHLNTTYPTRRTP